jgi:alkylation response protein AidB-like acyl-CoA dehydrogenase
VRARGWTRLALTADNQSIYGGTSEIMKTIIAREVTGLRT